MGNNHDLNRYVHFGYPREHMDEFLLLEQAAEEMGFGKGNAGRNRFFLHLLRQEAKRLKQTYAAPQREHSFFEEKTPPPFLQQEEARAPGGSTPARQGRENGSLSGIAALYDEFGGS